VPGVGELRTPGGRVEDEHEARDEHVDRDLRVEQVVDLGQHLPGRAARGGRGPQQRVRARHHQRGRHALVRHVPGHHHDAPVAQVDHVVEVPAHRPRGAVERRDVPAAQFGQLVGQELLLDELRDLELLLDPLEVPRLGLLLAHQLPQSQRRCRVPGEGVEEATVVARVAALGQARSERQHPHEFPRGHQRHHHLDVLFLHAAHGRRVRRQRGDLHRAGRRREEGQERVRGLDVDLDRHGGRLGYPCGLLAPRAAAPAPAPRRRRRPLPSLPSTGSVPRAGGAPHAGRGSLARRALPGVRGERPCHVPSRLVRCGVRPAVVVGTQHARPSVSGALRQSPIDGLRNARGPRVRYGRARPAANVPQGDA